VTGYNKVLVKVFKSKVMSHTDDKGSRPDSESGLLAQKNDYK
jgi:hypothetical protein